MTAQSDFEWTAKIKRTMAVDLGRFMGVQMPPAAIIDRLFQIPEVEEAFRLRADRRRPLALDPSTDVERREIVEAIERVATWLGDGFHEETVATLREIAGELQGEDTIG